MRGREGCSEGDDEANKTFSRVFRRRGTGGGVSQEATIFVGTSSCLCPTLRGFKKKRRERNKSKKKKRGKKESIGRQSQDRSRKFIDRHAICLAVRENKK